MFKETIFPDNWQTTRGTYSPVIKVDLGTVELIFVSGQQIAKAENNKAITDNIEEQTEYVFQELEKILQTAGSSLADVVKAQIFLTNIKDFPLVSAIRDKYFSQSKPASTLVEVKGMTRPGAKIEIDVIAIRKK